MKKPLMGRFVLLTALLWILLLLLYCVAGRFIYLDMVRNIVLALWLLTCIVLAVKAFADSRQKAEESQGGSPWKLALRKMIVATVPCAIAIVFVQSSIFSIYSELTDAAQILEFKRADSITSFSEGVAPCNQNMKWGYIRLDGTWELEPQYERAEPFSEGLAMVASKGKYGYIDHNGQVKVPLIYSDGTPFSDSLASVEYEGKWLVIDSVGRELPGLVSTEPIVFQEGLAPFYVEETNLYGYIDQQGEMVMPAEYRVAGGVSSGVMAVRSDWDLKCRYINTAGNTVFEDLPLEYSGDFSDGMAMVFKTGDDMESFIDTEGQVVFQVPENLVCQKFSEGYIAYQSVLGKRKYGYLDSQGNMVIPPILDFAGSFQNGVAKVVCCGKTLLIKMPL